MTPGSQQQRRFRIAVRSGSTVEDAAAIAGIGIGEARLIAAEDAKSPPTRDAYRLLIPECCAACAGDVCGCPDLLWQGIAA